MLSRCFVAPFSTQNLDMMTYMYACAYATCIPCAQCGIASASDCISMPYTQVHTRIPTWRQTDFLPAGHFAAWLAPTLAVLLPTCNVLICYMSRLCVEKGARKLRVKYVAFVVKTYGPGLNFKPRLRQSKNDIISRCFVAPCSTQNLGVSTNDSTACELSVKAAAYEGPGMKSGLGTSSTTNIVMWSYPSNGS